MAVTTVDHVILTRFNLPTQGVEGLVRAQSGWLADRVDLFERYCAPSVAQQSSPVTWLVYFDPESPDWLWQRLMPMAERGLFRPVLRSTVSQDDLLADISESIPKPGDVLLTTNLDNDDGLAHDFASRVAGLSTHHPRTVIYMTRGLIKSDVGVFVRTDRRNAFCSVREPWQSAVTAWSEYHNEFPRIMPVSQIGGPPGWLQVVHGRNISNRIRGRRVSPRPYRDRFGAMLDDASSPGRADLGRDLLLGLPLRTVRDASRSAVRIGGLKILGKRRYQAAKLRFSELLHR